jgi:hypothetical protein
MPLENIHKLRESLETEEEMNPAEEEASPSNTKVSVSVIGDVFIDLFCYLDSNDYPVLGGDVRIEKPSEYDVVVSLWLCSLTLALENRSKTICF